MTDSVRASHLLIKHAGSRRPASWRDPDGVQIRATSQSAANEELLALRAKIVSGQASLAELAKTRSDCSSATSGGDLGSFGRGAMQKTFEDAAFSLKVDQLSGVVSSDSGLHLILRTA